MLIEIITIIDAEIPLAIVVALLKIFFDFRKYIVPSTAVMANGINKYLCLEISEFSSSESFRIL